MKLKEIAHIRTGDKGNTCNICVIPYKEEHYEFIKNQITTSLVANFYKEICHGTVTRYEIDSISSLNFVLTDALGGGATKSLCQDRHGKSLGMALAEIILPDSI